jgi:GNAT superfamily N-acetyltransferase
MVEIRISQLSADDAAGLDRAYAIYRDAILKSEQRTEEDFRALILRSDYRFVVAKRDEDIIGVAVSWAPENSDMWLFEYGAVIPEERGKQIGSHLLLASRSLIGIQKTALIEADADTGTEDQQRRLRFYSRLGARQISGLDYILPLEAFGRPPPMILLAMAHPDITGLSVVVVEDWLRRIYYEVYGKGLDDPRLARMIDPLPDEVMLAII